MFNTHIYLVFPDYPWDWSLIDIVRYRDDIKTMLVADIVPKWPIYCLHFLPIMRWYWLPIPLRHQLLIPCRYSLPMQEEERETNKVDVDGRSIVIISTSSQSRASIALVTRPIVNICIDIEISYRANFPHFCRFHISGDVSETDRELQ